MFSSYITKQETRGVLFYEGIMQSENVIYSNYSETRKVIG